MYTQCSSQQLIINYECRDENVERPGSGGMTGACLEQVQLC